MTRLIDADALKYEPLPKGDRNYRTYNLDDAYDDGYDDAFTDIRNAPTIDAVPQWIPCSERLPEEGEVVLTQAKFKDDVKMAVSARVDFNYWTGWGTREIDIVAWMPLPKPYEE